MAGYFWLPGVSGNYASSDDVNLLDADSAHHHQSLGTYALVATADTPSLEAESSALFGDNVFQFLAASPAGGTQVAIGWASLGNGPAISPATDYALSMRVRTLCGSDRTAQVALSCWNSTSFVNQLTGSTATLPADGSWVTLSVSGTSGAGVDNGLPYINITDAADNDIFQIDVACLRTGSDATFIPSYRIVGDLDWEMKLAMTDWTPATENWLYSAWDSSLGYVIRIPNSGVIQVAGNHTAQSTAATGITDGDVGVLRVTRDASTGDFEFYKDGVQLGTTVSTSAAPTAYPTGVAHAIGANGVSGLTPTAGEIYYVTLRDGIDGPIVFDADFTNLSDDELDAGSFTTDEGRTVTLNGTEWAYPRLKTSIAGKTPELLLEANTHTDGIPMWSDRSGNNHHAQFGSAAGADTNDPLFKKRDGEPYTWFPGTSGNYISTDDVNLLDADTAHVQQSLGFRAGSYRFGSDSLEADTEAEFGDYVSRHVATETNTDGFISITGEITNGVAISASTQFWARARFRPQTAGEWRFSLIYWDAGGSYLGEDATSAVAVAAGEWHALTETKTTPASTAFVTVRLRTNNLVDGEWVDVDTVMVSLSAITQFVPSCRIVGDIDVEAKAACSLSSNQTLLNRYGGSGNRAWRLVPQSDGSFDFWYTLDGATGIVRSSDTSVLTANTSAVMRVTRDTSDQIEFYVDGVSAGSIPGGSSGALSGVGEPVYLGGRVPSASEWFDGDIYYVTVRDGIGGPIVAHYTPADAVEPFATQVGATDSRTYTYNRSASGYVTTVVDRDMFLLSTDDELQVPDDVALDFAADEDFTIFVLGRIVDVSAATNYILYKQSVAPNYSLYVTTAGTLTAATNDGGGAITDALAGVTDLTSHIWVARRDTGAAEVEAGLDGVMSGSPASDPSPGDLSNADFISIGSYGGAGYLEGQIVAVALFREALTDEQIAAVGAALLYGEASRRRLARPGMVLQTG